MEEKNAVEKLEKLLKDAGRLAVAFSGGVDSTFLLAGAAAVLGQRNVLAVCGKSSFFPVWEQERAAEFCREKGIAMIPVTISAADIPGFCNNPPDRCYHCKMHLFRLLKSAAAGEGFPVLADGTNTDDFSDYRPGIRALRELDIFSPLAEAGMGKQEIRQEARRMGLEIWDTPACACLATRIPVDVCITEERLERIGRAEAAIHGMGFSQVRVRDCGDTARIEVLKSDIARMAAPDMAFRVQAAVREAGFRFAALDLNGYVMGSMNVAPAGCDMKETGKER